MKGFTLLEVMVALAIIAGTVVTVIGAVNYQLSVVARDREESVAQLLARSKLEELEQAKEMPERQEGTFAPAWPAYVWRLTAAQTQIPGYRKFAMTVSWNGERRQVSLVHYLAR